MPKGPGTYGSKVGRPKKKKTMCYAGGGLKKKKVMGFAGGGLNKKPKKKK